MAGDGEFIRLGPYLLLRTSGAGGMGRIELCLRAEPGGIATLCVLKRMHAELRSPEQEARFRREANIARQLLHAAIAQTVGVEEIDGELLLLQEHVHGVDVRLLQTRLATAGQRMPLAIAVHIASEVARALAYAHASGDRGIVHRDVTPDNVMLSFSGDVKLVDFGIARSNVDATLTGAGHVVGRPTYTAPEIWDGAQADRRADIYSLGVVLWQLLTARRFESVRPRGTRPAPAPSAYNSEVPPALDAVVARALAPDPARRHQTADELHEALRPCLPAGFVPQPALAELIARHFDVARERQMLAGDVARARRFLAAEDPAPTARPPAVVAPAAARPAEPATSAAATTGSTSLSARRTKVAAGLGAATLCAVAVVAGLRRPVPAPIVAVRATPAAESPRAVAAATHPAPGPRTPTVAPPPRAHPIATSAGRARPPGAKPARPAPSTPADELLRRAQDNFDLGETEVALALARQAAVAGARAPAHILIGKVLMSERRFADAEREFAEAVRLDPDDARAAGLLALVRETRSSAP